VVYFFFFHSRSISFPLRKRKYSIHPLQEDRTKEQQNKRQHQHNLNLKNSQIQEEALPSPRELQAELKDETRMLKLKAEHLTEPATAKFKLTKNKRLTYPTLRHDCTSSSPANFLLFSWFVVLIILKKLIHM